MTRQARATIDGREVEAAGQPILDAARALGVSIPTLCHVPGLSREGGCRMCLVEVDARGTLRAACHTALQPGMCVNTRSPRVAAVRRDVLSLTLSALPEGRLTPDVNGNEVERLMAEYGVSRSEFGHAAECAVEASHPYLRFDASLCITCRRCLHTCEEVQGQFVYSVGGRGASTRLLIGGEDRFARSGCTSCGACVDHCPTGALGDVDRVATLERATRTDSVCGYCGVGCRVRIDASGGRVARVAGVPDAAVNHGHLCAKGRYAHGYHHHRERLTTPLLRRNGALTPIGWGEAVAWMASRFTEIRDRRGPDAVAAIASSRSTNEAAYLLQKFMRAVIGTNNVDCCARVCHSSTAAALAMSTGIAAASASFADIERARCIVVAGANPTEAHPVVGARIKQAVLRGASLLVIDPRAIELSEYASLHLRLKPGTNVALFNAIARGLIDLGAVDWAYVGARTQGFTELSALLRATTVEASAAVCGVPAEKIRAAAAMLRSAGNALFVHGLGLSELTQGTGSVLALTNLGMLTGSIGRPGAGMLPLRGQNNVQGAADMGADPGKSVGGAPVSDAATRERLGRLWGATLPATPGKTIPEMLDAARRGGLSAMWIQGEDLAQSETSQEATIAALRAMEMVVVQDLFLCESAEHAHLVLPAASTLEQSGTFTNGERRVQLVRPAVAPPGEARPDWVTVRDVARAMGHDWKHESPAQVMDEIARAAPTLFGGISYARLDGDGLQWPCPTADHPGSASVHVEGFVRGKGLLAAVDHQPGPEQAGGDLPLTLITGRVLQHYNVGTMTRRTPHRELASCDWLQVHPLDADRLGLGEGAWAEVVSRWGSTRVPVERTRVVPEGVVFLSFHFVESHTNRLLGPHVDPISKCPNFKVTAVRVAPIAPAAAG